LSPEILLFYMYGLVFVVVQVCICWTSIPLLQSSSAKSSVYLRVFGSGLLLPIGESVIFCISNRGFPRFQQRICERLAKCTSREALLSRKASLHIYPDIKPIGKRDHNYAWVQVVTIKESKSCFPAHYTFPVELALLQCVI